MAKARVRRGRDGTVRRVSLRPRRNPSGDDKGYQGWANWETWNVALWISDDEGLYSMAKQFRNRSRGNYKAFVESLREAAEGTAVAYETPDGAAWNDSGLDTDALDEMIQEL